MTRDLCLFSIAGLLALAIAGEIHKTAPYDIAGLNKLASEAMTRDEATAINEIFNPKE